ncbi:DUF3040 domain-containing protein [Actinoplanes awajinensis]|uniref:DUF3040 domain-containing protein n=1 Tax=Actinoplanes awajinensis subsp. mycoplanecinus TaxID=135947 RepID=A0A124G7F0_9ACTN|nr:DUF3040 domain-containing protein [Actinoplanes awajinensis]KUL22437.1 hypothetical protein ADL15_48815 [Actinoplanes awajinensis subsp. mycoplanecinus]
MLEEQDSRVLADIERRLCSTDPAFARRMRSGTGGRAFPAVSVVCVLAFLALPFVGLFLGPRGALLVLDAAAILVMVILAVRFTRR